MKDITNIEYGRFLSEIKSRIISARLQAVRPINRELIKLYWDIGKNILERQEKFGWGKSVVEKLSRDLKREFLSAQGYSVQNLWYMRQFYLEYADQPNLQQLVGEIPWGHNILIMQKVKNAKEREYYIKASLSYGWSRNVLLNQTIGIVLCADRENIVVEYALRSVKKPVGVAEYYLTKKLPKAFQGKLPDAESFKLSIQQELKLKGRTT